MKMYLTQFGTEIDVRRVVAVGPAIPTGAALPEDEVWSFEILMEGGHRVIADGFPGESSQNAHTRREQFVVQWFAVDK